MIDVDPIRFTLLPRGDFAIFYWEDLLEKYNRNLIGEWKPLEDGRMESVISIEDLYQLREQLNAIFATMDEEE